MAAFIPNAIGTLSNGDKNIDQMLSLEFETGAMQPPLDAFKCRPSRFLIPSGQKTNSDIGQTEMCKQKTICLTCEHPVPHCCCHAKLYREGENLIWRPLYKLKTG